MEHSNFLEKYTWFELGNSQDEKLKGVLDHTLRVWKMQDPFALTMKEGVKINAPLLFTFWQVMDNLFPWEIHTPNKEYFAVLRADVDTFADNCQYLQSSLGGWDLGGCA
ncbi:hypothetical protein VKT23_005456 [Stygiomarasmius scandens]|uniref:Uncharacterized protein n=1 Tax=Marasmiellus scandens TaxID=2682957 RepID=A0ABR1JUW4_9AGAR